MPRVERRGFFRSALAALGLGAAPRAAAAQAQPQPSDPIASGILPAYCRAQNYRSLKQSSYDTTGGNSDRWPIAPGKEIEIF
ncbi:MAG: DUF2961 domain-containing protein, partial [Bryobacteraceae bacterium]|nr:DUF2961 domain-containing protein [Bryobacteraceae bacterium]